MRILVTGGAGFVGGALVEELLVSGHEVVVLDRRAPRSPDGPNLTAVLGDVRDAAAWDEALPGVEAVAHLAAKVGLGVDLGDVTDYVGVNDGGTAAGLLALHRRGWRGRLVLASSMVVYGEGTATCPAHGTVRPAGRTVQDLDAARWEPRCSRHGCERELAPATVDEASPVDPRNVYAATKLHQEHLCGAWAREAGTQVVALRYHNVYGPGLPRDTPYAGVASLFLSALRRGEAPQVMEDGRQRRDFVHVADVARATALALTVPGPLGGALNVASGDPRTVGELAEALADAVGPGAPRPEVVGGYRVGDVRHVVASPERAGEVLGFRASVPFAEGIATLVAAEGG